MQQKKYQHNSNCLTIDIIYYYLLSTITIYYYLRDIFLFGLYLCL